MHASNFGCTTCTSGFITLSSLLYDLPTHWSRSGVKNPVPLRGIEGIQRVFFSGCPIYAGALDQGGPGGWAPLELGIYKVKFLKIRKIPFFLLHRAPPT